MHTSFGFGTAYDYCLWAYLVGRKQCPDARTPVAVDDVVDVATLTGAQMVATGRRFAGIVSDSETLEKACVDAGRTSGDLAHPLPYAPEFFSREFGSAVADMRNSVKDRANAQASCAGQFIADHLAPGFAEPAGPGGDARQRRWLHVDIAGPAFKDDRATGFVRSKSGCCLSVQVSSTNGAISAPNVEAGLDVWGSGLILVSGV